MNDVTEPNIRAIVMAAARALGIALVLLAVYYVIPIDGVGQIGTAIGLILTLVIFFAALIWEATRILTAEYPIYRAAEALMALLPLLILLFAALYFAIERQTPNSFSEPFNRTGALYFTVTTFATVGFGDITPISDTARWATMIQMLIDLAVLGVSVRLLIGVARVGRARREAAERQLPD